jgi:hypothetical protein
MVFIFGFDFPLIEALLVMGLIMVLLFGLLIFVLKRIMDINHKLDEVLAEEHLVHEEMEHMRTEEMKQLGMIAKHISVLDEIGEEETKQMAYIKDVMKTLSATKPGKAHMATIKKITDQIKKIHSISDKENKQLAKIQDMVTRFESMREKQHKRLHSQTKKK